MIFVLYNAGSGGDMVSSVIDSTDYTPSNIEVTATPNSDRLKIKMNIINSHSSGIYCNHLFVTQNKETGDFEKSELFVALNNKYKSLTTGHDFTVTPWASLLESEIFLIDDSEYKYTKWCMDRCRWLSAKHHPAFSETHYKDRFNRINFAKKYPHVKVIDFKDIIEGRLITVLQQWVDTPLNAHIYEHWLTTIATKVPPVEDISP